MRERKYRIWDRINKRMIYLDKLRVYQSYAIFDDDVPLHFKITSEDNLRGIGFHDDFIDDNIIPDVEVLDYTGFKDKNEKEIYEDDIIRLSSLGADEIGIVKYGFYDNLEDYEDKVQGYGWYIQYGGKENICGKKHDVNNLDNLISEIGDVNIIDSLEVIGNKYENPDLDKD